VDKVHQTGVHVWRRVVDFIHPYGTWNDAEIRAAALKNRPRGFAADVAATISDPIVPRHSRSSLQMPETVTIGRGQTELRVARPPLHKVILINDDYTPRGFVVGVLKTEFRLGEDKARQVMSTAHQRGACVVAVFTKEVAETKATNAVDAARKEGFPLMFTTEPEE
jgi:ATP-dependent Clp protease adaptor protein ClpS